MGVSITITTTVTVTTTVVTFYSLMGVSRSVYSVRRCVHVRLSAFYSLMGVSGINAGAAIALHSQNFLLPYGSFLLHEIMYRSGCRAEVSLSTPLWEFQSVEKQRVINQRYRLLSTPLWEFLREFLTKEIPKKRKSNFLLPYGSFICRNLSALLALPEDFLLPYGSF